MVAIVDDDDLMRSALQGLLKAVGMPAQAFASAEEFLKSGQQRQARCLITDIRMPGMSGLELQARLKADGYKASIIFITAHGEAPIFTPGPGPGDSICGIIPGWAGPLAMTTPASRRSSW